MVRRRMSALPTFVLPLLGAVFQGPDEVLATYLLEGKPAVVSRTDVALEMAFHLRRRDRGQEAVNHLADAAITRRVATEKQLLPAETEVREAWRKLMDELRAAGRRPEEFPAMRNTSEQQWLADLAVQLAQERIVRAELGLSAKEKVSGDMLQLWLQDARKKAAVVTDPDLLPAGTAVRVGSTEVPLLDLGLLLLRTAEDDERDEFTQKIVLLNTVEALARREGVEVSAADLDASVQKRRDEAANDPRFRGVSLENILKAEGLTVAALRDLRVFRAHILLDKLARRRFGDAELAKELAADRQGVLDRVGPRRHIGLVFVRALAEPNGLITRDFAAAEQHLLTVRARLEKETFANVAKIESEHASSKMQGGDTGWHRRRSERLPEPVLAAAFALPVGEISQPLRLPEGCFLVKTLEAEAEPDDAVLRQRLRELKVVEMRQQLLQDAKVELVKKPGATK